MIRNIKIGDIIYLLMSPTNKVKEYYYTKCKVTRICIDKVYSLDSIEIDTTSFSSLDNITFGLTNVDNTHKYYCNKHISKLYFDDELDSLNQDIVNLNKILKYKEKQKNELKEYVDKEFPAWEYRGNLSI